MNILHQTKKQMLHHHKYCILLLLLTIGIITDAVGQMSYKDYKKSLRSKDGSSYVSAAYAGAQDLAQQGEFKDALSLLDRAVKKAKSLGMGPHSVLLVNKSELIASDFPNKEEYHVEIVESIETLRKYELPLKLMEKSRVILQKINFNTSTALGARIATLISENDIAIVKEQNKVLEEAKKVKVRALASMDDEVVYDEMERLKSERIRLEQLQVNLAQSIKENKRVLRNRAREINRMSREQAKKEAILQYNKRMIDSLNFMAQLDSVQIQKNELMISEQKSKLALQTSELQLKDSELALKSSQQKFYLVLSILGLALSAVGAWLFFYQRRTTQQLQAKNEEIEMEKDRSDELLLNILPKFVAQELKEKSKVKTRTVNECTVLFTDFINFSQISKQIEPEELIEALDECFRAFDEIASRHNIEKIKTIGDAYMCASGVPRPNKDHAVDAVGAALEMIAFLEGWNAERGKEGKVRFDARIGLHSGPIIAGVVGMKKFAYDIWGDTVNIASRIESHSSAQKVNISASTYQLVKDVYACNKRGSLSVKNMPDIEMYFIDKRLPEPSMN